MLPDSFMTSFFCELFARSAAARLHTDDVLQRIDALLTIFPNAPYLLVSRGQTLHLMQDLEASEASYEAARNVDPHRLEGMADYSNSLFVQNKEEKLAHLTHMLAEAGREDAEICCAIGNYHTLRGDNHRAVEVFKRGVRLDPGCASAWILLGHGYIELKDSMAAAEMYRKALELNPRDVRAWTGLGNTYELNAAWSQALHYHKKAASSSPYDFRFWASMANCYEKLDQPMQAIECYKRILALEQHVDAQLAIMDNIARLYETLADTEEDEEEDDDEEEYDEGGEYVGSDGFRSKSAAAAALRAHDLLRACAWHRKIVELIDRSRQTDDMVEEDEDDEDGAEQAQRVKEHVGSFLIAARWEMGLINVEDQIDQRASRKTASPRRAPIGNLSLAHDYLQRVIMTGTEAVLEAEELLKGLALLQT
jgi:anaphase-promoting complex subunit 8